MNEIERLPLFPLGLVLFPAETIPLHIFEERYRLLVRESLELDQPFGIVMAEEQEMQMMGCTVRISRVLAKHDDGRVDIAVTGESRFRINQVHTDRPFLTADVQLIGPGFETTNVDARERLITQHMRLVELLGETIRPVIYEDTAYVSFVVGQNAGLDMKQRQELLELISEEERIEYLIRHFTDLIPRLEEAQEFHRRVRSNGHVKE
jgi:ATP-dependent Lon protease